MIKTIEIPDGRVAVIYLMKESKAELYTKAALRAYSGEFNQMVENPDFDPAQDESETNQRQSRKHPLTAESMAAFSKQKAIDYYDDLGRWYLGEKAKEAVTVEELTNDTTYL